MASHTPGTKPDANEPASLPQDTTFQPSKAAEARPSTAAEAGTPSVVLKMQDQQTFGTSLNRRCSSDREAGSPSAGSPVAAGANSSTPQATSPIAPSASPAAAAGIKDQVAEDGAGGVNAGQSVGSQPAAAVNTDASDAPRRPLVKRTCTQAMLMVRIQ